MESKDDYIKRLRDQLEDWNAQIAELRDKADRARDEAQMEYHQELDELEGKRNVLRAHLDDLGSASEEAWTDKKHGADNAWMELDAAFNRALMRLN